MTVRSVLAAAVALCMTASPVLAATANPAARLSLRDDAPARASAQPGESTALGRPWLIAFAAAGTVAFVLLVTKNKNSPKSP